MALLAQFRPSTSYAHGAKQPVATDQPPDEAPHPVYAYVAQSGDSYSLITRKAIQTYGLKKEIKLTPAQIIYAETDLTKAGGSPRLNVGQTVTVNEADVEATVAKAQKLTPAQETAWNYYVRFAEFNTSSVGEAR